MDLMLIPTLSLVGRALCARGRVGCAVERDLVRGFEKCQLCALTARALLGDGFIFEPSHILRKKFHPFFYCAKVFLSQAWNDLNRGIKIELGTFHRGDLRISITLGLLMK